MKDRCEIKLTRDPEAIHSFIHSFHPLMYLLRVYFTPDKKYSCLDLYSIGSTYRKIQILMR